MLKKLPLLLLLFLSCLDAKTLYSFTNLNINYLDWSRQTEESTTKRDFSYVGLEGGAGWEWGSFYGFFNLENPINRYDSTRDALRFSAFGDLDINIKSGFKLHIQNYHLQSDPFYVNDFVLGASYKYSSDFGLWVRPFLGLHITNSSYYDGFNGYMAGWTLNYDFKISDANFSIFHWNEIEFARERSFYEDSAGLPIGDAKRYGFHGALSGWWHSASAFSTGLQYRYAKYKLGFAHYQSAIIYSLKYNF